MYLNGGQTKSRDKNIIGLKGAIDSVHRLHKLDLYGFKYLLLDHRMEDIR